MEVKGHLLYYPEGKHDINLGNYVLKNQLNDALKSKVDSITKTTYANLKNLRDNSQLTPGSLYRITDYQCTTTQENTRSAGHQFDIVLLALSEDKLAEEGWAMMHDTPIYNVNFNGGERRKCYFYPTDDENCNLVDCNTLLGCTALISDITFNEEDKTADYIDGESETDPDYYLSNEGLTYNYFQNSNLSAWKVWYSLDNDKDRFAWADDREGYLISGQSELGIWDNRLVLRAPGWDAGDIYGWKIVGTDAGIFTKTLDINVGQLQIYNSSGNLLGVVTVSSAIKVYNGRGVIYRLIDEWNNDVGYDFKNIQYQLRLEDNAYIDGSTGEYTWVYTFDALNLDTGKRTDATLIDRAILIDDGYNKISNNFIGAFEGYNTVTELPYICFLLSWNSDDTYFGVYGNVFNNLHRCYFSNELSSVLAIGCFFGSDSRLIRSGTIYINNKKVLTES